MILGTLVQGQPGNNIVDKLISHTIGPHYENSRIITLGGYKFYQNTALNAIDCPNVSNIAYAAFVGCTNLKEAYFPSCYSLGGQAFSGCTNLTSIILPWSSITSIGQYAFYNCQKLPFSISNNNLISVDYATFRSCYLLTEISLPNCVQLAGEAFFACYNLSEVYLPNLSSISGVSPFYQCSKLSCIDFPLISYIQQTAFQHCIDASYIKLPKATTIGNSAMANCSKVSYAYIGGTGTISANAFGNCWTLLSLYLLGSTMRTLGNVNVFNSTPISTYTTQTGGVQGSIFVPSSLYASYIAATNWTTYSDRFVSMTDAEIEALKTQLGIT